MEDFSYIGRKSCDCVVCAIVDMPDHKGDVAREVARWIKEGLTVERVTLDYAREHFVTECPHLAPVKGQMRLPL